MPQVKNIIAVGSGKGGVGKSTIAFNLAHTLAQNGLNIGLLDADIYGPSLPTLLGNHDRLGLTEDKKFIPHQQFGLHCVSVGHLVSPETALAWRGPMASGAMMQLFQQTKWPALDILVVDLPPGTGDLILSLCQKVPLSGAVVVSHPHPLAQADKERAQALFEKMGLQVLLQAANMQPQQAQRSWAYSPTVYEATASALPVGIFAPGCPEQQCLQLWAEDLVDALAQQPIFAPVPFQMR